jgi:hypothetical protein
MNQSNNEKKSGYRFEPGNKFGQGRPAGSRNKATEALQTLLDEEGEKITRRAVELALDGDTTALRLCLERLLPPARERRVSLNIPKLESAGDIAKALGTLLDSVANGEITPSEGQTIAALLEIQRKAMETAELEQRITRLEANAQDSRDTAGSISISLPRDALSFVPACGFLCAQMRRAKQLLKNNKQTVQQMLSICFNSSLKDGRSRASPANRGQISLSLAKMIARVPEINPTERQS